MPTNIPFTIKQIKVNHIPLYICQHPIYSIFGNMLVIQGSFLSSVVWQFNIISPWKFAYKKHSTQSGVKGIMIDQVIFHELTQNSPTLGRHIQSSKRAVKIPRYVYYDDGNSPALAEWEGYYSQANKACLITYPFLKRFLPTTSLFS